LPAEQRPPEGLFSYNDDFINLVDVARDFPFLHEVRVADAQDFRKKLDVINSLNESIPILLNEADGDLKIIPANYDFIDYETDSRLVYLGKKVDFDNQPEVEEAS
jgi:hypothetical protein